MHSILVLLSNILSSQAVVDCVKVSISTAVKLNLSSQLIAVFTLIGANAPPLLHTDRRNWCMRPPLTIYIYIYVATIITSSDIDDATNFMTNPLPFPGEIRILIK